MSSSIPESINKIRIYLQRDPSSFATVFAD